MRPGRRAMRHRDVSGRTRASERTNERAGGCKWSAIRERLNNSWVLGVALRNQGSFISNKVAGREWGRRAGHEEAEGGAADDECLLWISVLLCLPRRTHSALSSALLALSDQSRRRRQSRNWCRHLCSCLREQRAVLYSGNCYLAPARDIPLSQSPESPGLARLTSLWERLAAWAIKTWPLCQPLYCAVQLELISNELEALASWLPTM